MAARLSVSLSERPAAALDAEPPAARRLVERPKLVVRRLCKSYGPTVALAETDLEIRGGEFLTLLGPSGSGKTTLLSMIAGLVVPDSGEIWIDGHEATYAPPETRDIGMVFQNYALFPHMTVFENVAFPLRMRGVADPTIAREVERALDMVRLPNVAARLPNQLSGGQQQRVALARCMIYRPSIVLMDEPLGALDKKLREQMQLEIKCIHTEVGLTIIYVTHDQEEALVLSDRICLMNNARVEQIGTPQDLYFRPATLFAADFLGESNIFDVTAIERQFDCTLLAGPGRLPLRAPPLAPELGGALIVMIRPENMRVLTAGETADNELEADLTDIILAGQITRYYGRLPDGQRIIAAKLSAVDRGPVLATGSKARFGWGRDAMVLLARPDTSS